MFRLITRVYKFLISPPQKIGSPFFKMSLANGTVHTQPLSTPLFHAPFRPLRPHISPILTTAIPFSHFSTIPKKPLFCRRCRQLWQGKGKQRDPFAFSCLLFNPAFSGRFTLVFPLIAALLTHVSSPFSSLLKRALFPVFCSGTCSLSLRLPLPQIRPTRACFTFHRYLPRFGTKNRTSGQIERHVAKQLFLA